MGRPCINDFQEKKSAESTASETIQDDDHDHVPSYDLNNEVISITNSVTPALCTNSKSFGKVWCKWKNYSLLESEDCIDLNSS